jgi:hypothetical protein
MCHANPKPANWFEKRKIDENKHPVGISKKRETVTQPATQVKIIAATLGTLDNREV